MEGYSNCTSGSIRLVDGSSDNEGLVQLCIDGIWGSICGSNWYYFNAEVACRQLGYSEYGKRNIFILLHFQIQIDFDKNFSIYEHF